MSHIRKLEVLIEWEAERGEELEAKIKYEEKLLEEAEHWKLVVRRQILEEWWHAVKRDNMLQEEKLLNIRKCKEHTLGDVCELEKEFAAMVSYLVLHCIFSCIFWSILLYIVYLQVFVFIAISYLYMYIF